MVDERDFQLLAHLLREPLASNEELGRRVRLSGTAVKTRLAGLTEEGVFGGLYGIPAPEVFQRRRHVYVFRGERVNATAPHKAIQMDPVVSVHLRQDGNLPAILYEPPNESADPPEELVRTFGAPAFSVLPRPFQAPPKGTVLSPIDWRVMRPLIREPRMPVRTLAERTGLSPKTVRRHRDALLRDGALTIEVHVRGARAPAVQLVADLAPPAPAGPPRDPDEAAPVRRRERHAGASRHLPLLSGRCLLGRPYRRGHGQGTGRGGSIRPRLSSGHRVRDGSAGIVDRRGARALVEPEDYGTNPLIGIIYSRPAALSTDKASAVTHSFIAASFVPPQSTESVRVSPFDETL